MANFVELENVTGIVQKAYSEAGDAYIMTPRSSKAWPEHVANLFLDQRKAQVRRIQDTDVPPVLIKERPVWLANMMGNPFEPKEWEIEVLEKDVPVIKKIPNQKAVSRTLRYEIHIGQGEDPYGQIPEGITSSVGKDFNLPAKLVVIRPRQRVCVGHNIANVILQRDALCGDLGHGQVLECRAPTIFEPGMSWDLPKILFYAKMVAEDDFGVEWLRAEYTATDPERKTRREAITLKDVLRSTLWTEQMKDAALGRLFYRLVNLDYALPSEAAFNKHYEESVTALKEGKAVPRGPGRPKKIDEPKAAPIRLADDAPLPPPSGDVAQMMQVIEAGLAPQLEAENAPIEQISAPYPVATPG